jgi:A/G-specific adenine glycosylase
MIENPLFEQAFLQEHQELKNIFYALKKHDASQEKIMQAFGRIIYHLYENKRRSFAWREHISPYRVIVSEIMLQQTQTDRVADKFEKFITAFPDFETLSRAPFSDVLLYWKGLGYNRRALALQKIASIVTHEHAGIVPHDIKTLESWPSIGKATARSITTFAFNQPTTFIETNIRTVFIYFFFPNGIHIYDDELEPLVHASVDQKRPRDWYYALMDYGVMLKKTIGNFSKQSKHHTKQSRFIGSDRQLRGVILQMLLDEKHIDYNLLCLTLDKDQDRVKKIVNDLYKEGFLFFDNERNCIFLRDS